MATDTSTALAALNDLRVLRVTMDVICHRMDDLQDAALDEMDVCLKSFEEMPTAAANDCAREVKKIATYAVRHLRAAADDIVAAVPLTPEEYKTIIKELSL